MRFQTYSPATTSGHDVFGMHDAVVCDSGSGVPSPPPGAALHADGMSPIPTS